MAASGVAWGVYSLLGTTRAGSPLVATAEAFLGAVPWALAAAGVAALAEGLHADATGWACAAASGAVTSALGYVAWYAILPSLGPARAAVLQLLVPVLTALAATTLLGEPLGPTWAAAAVLVLGGVALATPRRRAALPTGT
jgi:drug/metabolite transporter (DMT)-like permease